MPDLLITTVLFSASVAPATTTCLSEIDDPYTPDAVTTPEIRDNPCTNAPTCVLTVVLESVQVTFDTVGTTDDGAVSVNVALFVPTVVLPLFVTTVIVPVPDVVFGIRSSSDIGGVHDTVSPALELIVPVLAPNLYVTVWVNDEDALGRLIVFAVFAVKFPDQFGVVARGIVGSEYVPDAP